MLIIYLVQWCFAQRVSFSNLEVILFYYLIKWHPYCTGDYELFDENKCCGRESVGVSWILTFLSSRSSWGVRVPPELLPLLLHLDVTKWPTKIDRQKNKYKVTKIKLIKMTKIRKNLEFGVRRPSGVRLRGEGDGGDGSLDSEQEKDISNYHEILEK